jgi:hypothetical protein
MDADADTVVSVVKQMRASGKAIVGMKILGQDPGREVDWAACGQRYDDFDCARWISLRRCNALASYQRHSCEKRCPTATRGDHSCLHSRANVAAKVAEAHITD